MKFVINKSDIRNVLAKVQGLTGRKTNLAITENILIEAIDGGIKIIATDLETGFEGIYPATVESKGLIAINAKKLFEITRDFPAEEILLDEVENRWIQIGNQNIEYHIVGMNPEDFPDSPRIEDIDFFEMDSAALKRMIEKTVIVSGAPDDKRAHINGVYFESVSGDEQNCFRIVSTDGSRLSTVDYPYEGDMPTIEGVIIPKKGLHEALKFLNNDGAVQIGLKDNHFIINKQSETITIRLLEGDFPKYQDIVKKNDGHQIQMDRQLFLMMLRRMSILSTENYKGVVFNFSSNKLLVTATNPDIGESKEEMEVDFDGEVIEAAFNPKFVIDALNVVDDNTAVLHIINGERPCLIEGAEDKSYLSVVMPMRI
ncbi:DNA polymerase III subunit beta [Desulfonema ishimotonii]|uniref:Beta sliding clamp n=1 Tax=Desulfonema ishimotonii TaxID=45657 RepID=A0A401G2N2_9BACT|nr:DNA polymerase III subunit beta [Desulfonema ishimotonii]GBC63385.1 DNA polymerase III subunit beta [Desulfonema ishimotonii]